MSDYRDYGTIGDVGATGVSIDTIRYGLVYLATHDGYGRLPYMNRSFTSFSFGTKLDGYGLEKRVYIEDFNLLATISNNRLSRNGYADFNDNVSSYDNLDGQFYWSTHATTNSITFDLSTDGIDLKLLDNFLHWFKPGVARELILSEHPNRAIMARVSKPPALSLLPFEGTVQTKIANHDYTVKTTLYKGEITLELVADDPYWYSVINVLGKKDEINKRYLDRWDDLNGEEVYIFASLDALKILYEDGIPVGSMIQNNMLLGNGSFAKVEDNSTSNIWSLAEADILWSGTPWASTPSGEGARIEANDAEPPYLKGVIAGAIIDVDGNGIVQLNHNLKGYFFYAGTAPAPTEIHFTIRPEFDVSGFFTAINDSVNNSGTPYNAITIKSRETLKLVFTTPNLILSYNKAVKLLEENLLGQFDIINLRETVVEQVKHPGVRAWVMSLLSDEDSLRGITVTDIVGRMTEFFKMEEDGNIFYEPITFKINSKTGEATADFKYREPTEELSFSNVKYVENALNKIYTISSHDENLTDMLRYENIVTWGWDEYCLNVENLSLPAYVPDLTSGTTEQKLERCKLAVDYFLEYVNYCIDNKISIPTVVTVKESTINISNAVSVTENVGDMLLSNNIVIRDRNVADENGHIIARTEEHPEYSYSIEHNLMVPLYNILILYKNMYL